MPHQAISDRLSALAATWRQDAARRLRMSSHDATAGVLEYCAAEMLAELSDAGADDEEVSVAEYAAKHGKSVSTVRAWCRSGALIARPVGREYRIRRGEPCPNLRLAMGA